MSNVPETLIIGADSYVGRHLLASYRGMNPRTLGTTRRRDHSGLPGLAFLDLEAPDLSALPLAAGDYRAAVIAAAVSKINQCARDPEATRRVNVAGMLRLIDRLQDRDILPIFFSSDYVFDGANPNGNTDEAPLCPSTEYGRHKAEVEQALHRSGKPYLVLRLSKIYSMETGDGSFLDEIASKLRAGQTYAAAHDQRFSPTHVADLAPAIMKVQALPMRGVVNFCAAQAWSRYDIALAVARRLGLPREVVQKISLDDLPGPVRRPKNTFLIPGRLTRETDIRFTPLSHFLWETADQSPSAR